MTLTPPPKRHAPKGRLIAKPGDPMASPDPMAGKCTATNRQKRRCTQPAIKGGTVCRYHGGSAPQVKAKAQARLLALQHPAIDRLTQLIAQQEFPSVAIAAVKDVLDRTLGKPTEQQFVEHSGAIVLKHELDG